MAKVLVEVNMVNMVNVTRLNVKILAVILAKPSNNSFCEDGEDVLLKVLGMLWNSKRF